MNNKFINSEVLLRGLQIGGAILSLGATIIGGIQAKNHQDYVIAQRVNEEVNKAMSQQQNRQA